MKCKAAFVIMPRRHLLNTVRTSFECFLKKAADLFPKRVRAFRKVMLSFPGGKTILSRRRVVMIRHLGSFANALYKRRYYLLLVYLLPFFAEEYAGFGCE